MFNDTATMADLFYQGPRGRRKRVVAQSAAREDAFPGSPGFEEDEDVAAAAATAAMPKKADAFRFGNRSSENKFKDDFDTSFDADEAYAQQIQAQENAKQVARRAEEEEAWFQDLVEAEGRCELCGENAGFDGVVILSRCEHRFCTTCLRSHIEDEVSRLDSGEVAVVCPLGRGRGAKESGKSSHATAAAAPTPCSCLIADSDLRVALGSKRHGEIMEAALARLIASESNTLRKCPNEECGAVIEQIVPSPECTYFGGGLLLYRVPFHSTHAINGDRRREAGSGCF